MLSPEEVNDSYNNAKRIQVTILPGEKFIKQVLPESFVIYLPKDTLSGDFFWVREVNDIVLFAVADCTGHGVPGAMLTVMCHGAIEKSLKEFGMVIPGHILDKTLEILVSDFKKNGQPVSDGMDIALCSITGNLLKFSGANRPLWIVRDRTLIELEPTKQGIGLVANPEPYITNDFVLNQGDILYLFSDGFTDQFGGKNDKKFMTSRLKNLLISINSLTMAEQKDILEKTFNEWKGTNDQTDDVSIMGVKI